MSDMALNKVNNTATITQGTNNNANTVQKTKQQVINNIANGGNTGHKETKKVSPTELQKIIGKINENVSILNKDVKFVYNDTIKSLVVKVINAKTGKVIREIPPKEVINLQKKLSEVVGIIFDSKEVK